MNQFDLNAAKEIVKQADQIFAEMSKRNEVSREEFEQFCTYTNGYKEGAAD